MVIAAEFPTGKKQSKFHRCRSKQKRNSLPNRHKVFPESTKIESDFHKNVKKRIKVYFYFERSSTETAQLLAVIPNHDFPCSNLVWNGGGKVGKIVF